MARKNPNISIGIDGEADLSKARKAVQSDLGKMEDDARDAAKGIERAFESVSPELKTDEIRKALDLAGQLDGMVASFTVETDLSEIQEAEKLAKALRGFQAKVDLSVEGREELADALDLAAKMDQIRQVKVQVQGREDLEKAARLAEDLDQRHTVKVDVEVDDSKAQGAGDKIASELESGGERGAAGIEDAIGNIDFADLGRSGAESMSGALAAAGPWGAAAAGIAALVGDEFAAGFSDALPAARTDLIRGLRTGLTGPELEEVGRVAADVWGDGFANGMSQSEMRDIVATVKAELEGLDEVELKQVTKEALLLSEAIGVELPEAITTAESMFARGLVGSISEGLNLMLELQQKTNIEWGEMQELIDEFGPALKALGIEGPQGFAMMADIFERRLTPQLDQAGEIFEELNENITNGGAAEALERITGNAEELTRRVVAGGPDAARAISEIAAAVLAIEDPTERANAAIAIFGGNVNLMGSDARDAIVEMFLLADGTRDVGDQLTKAVPAVEDTATGLDQLKRSAAGLAGELGTLLTEGIALFDDLKELDLHEADQSLQTFGESVVTLVNGPLAMLAEKVGLDVWGPFNDALDKLRDKVYGTGEEVAIAGRKFGEGGQGGREFADGARDAAGGADEAKTAVEQLSDAIDLFSGRFDEDQIMRRIEEDTIAATTAVEGLTSKAYELGTGFDTTTEKGRAAEAAFEDLSGSLDTAISSFERGHTSGQTLADTQVRVEGAVRQVAAAMGLTQAETDELVAKYATVPKEVSTTFVAHTQAAVGAVAGYAAAIAAIPSTKSTTVTTYQQTVVRPTASISSFGRASGGPVRAGELYTVGEMGRELFVPDKDGQIIDAASTRDILDGNPGARALAGASVGGGGGGQRVVLELRSSGSDSDEFLIRMIRKAVRNRGGNLDVVFG